MPRRPHHRAAAAYTNATVHPQHGHHRTTRRTLGSVPSLGNCRPHRRVRRPDTNAPGPRSGLPFLPSAQHTSCCYSTHLALTAGKQKALCRLPRSLCPNSSIDAFLQISGEPTWPTGQCVSVAFRRTAVMGAWSEAINALPVL
jgi:hypothetical protein